MLNGLNVGCIVRLYVCFPVPPANAKNTLQAANVEGFKHPDVSPIWIPTFRSIQQNRDADGFVNCDFGRHCQVVIQKHTASESTKS